MAKNAENKVETVADSFPVVDTAQPTERESSEADSDALEALSIVREREARRKAVSAKVRKNYKKALFASASAANPSIAWLLK